MKRASSPADIRRRRLLRGTAALVAVSALPAVAAAQAPDTMPDIAALKVLLAGRTPRRERLHLQLPAFADNGQAVPMHLVMDGPFTASPTLQAIHLFSETNPVPEMAVFEFPVVPAKVEIDSRIRLAGSQSIVALAVMSDGACYAAVAEVLVTIAGCLDGS
jgi:sulfur-oxidizing protein SoxY